MNEQQYFVLINYILIVNTLWVAGFGTLCFVWSGIARTATKKTIFAAIGGALFSYVFLRLIVAFLPANLYLLLLVGVLHGLMMATMFGAFCMVTLIAKKRGKEVEIAEQCREEACATPAAERWNSVEEKLLSFGREAGWL